MLTLNKIRKFILALIAMLFLFGELFTLSGQETGSFTDLRDGITYSWVKIGDQTWMSENLAYLPQVDTVTDGSEDISEGKFYYVYDFAPQPGNDETTQVTNAKATVNYQTYGVLYNWFASMDGYNSSGTNPSRVQGVCPTDWHMASIDEWWELDNYLEINGYGYEGGGNDIGKATAATSGWTIDGTPGNVGNDQASNNSSGFSALPGGLRGNSGTFETIGDNGQWWSSTDYSSAADAWHKFLRYNAPTFDHFGANKEMSVSVRCIRDIDYLSSLTISGEAGFDNVQELTGDTVQTIYLKNTGSSDLVIDSLSSMFQPFSRTVTLSPIPAGDSLAVNIFLNTEVLPDSYSDSLVIYLGMQNTAIYIDATVSMGAFSFINTGLQNVTNSSVAWGDYDNDGDLDLLLTGNTGGGFFSGIYRNDAGTLIDINAALSQVAFSSLAWGDYDNDGDLDILLTGDSGVEISKIYQNDNGAFTDINAPLTGVYNSSVDWGDWDNDGDLDILLTGCSEVVGVISRVYRNDTGTFVNINAGLTGGCFSSVEWGDYDKDGDLDILLAGDDPGHGPVSKIYQNNNGIFTDINAALTGVYNSSVSWGDYDNDGDLDILLTGTLGGDDSGISKIYQNNNGAFSDINAALTGFRNSSAAWGDWDNDGDLDIIITGESGSGIVSDVYRNDNGTFTSINVLFTGVASGSAKWGDYDNDGDLDILLTGDSGNGFISKLYRNNSPIANTPPAAPSGLGMINTGDSLKIIWSAASDNETPVDGLNYSLYLIEDNTDTLLMPPADITTGYNRLSERGIVQGTSKQYVNPGKGTYTWGVQAIDAAFAGSTFATANFIIDNQAPGTPQPDNPQNGYNLFADSVCLDWNAAEYDGDTIYYNIRCGVEGDMHLIADTITEDTLIARNLIPGEKYYWQVTAFDKYGASTTGDLWYFFVAITETEPNNDFSTSNCSVNGTGFYGTVGNGTDAADYFCITYPYNVIITITVENLNIYELVNGGLDIVRIYNYQQNEIADISDNSLNAGETSSTGTLMLNADETYFIEIKPELIADNVPYRLSFTIDTFSISDLFELNNTMETAYPLYRDSLYSYSGFWGDSGDWYAVSFTGTGTFKIRVTDPDDSYTIHSGLGSVQIYSSSGNGLTSNDVNNGESFESSQIGVSAGQTYFIEVPPGDAYSGAAYRLEIISDVQEIKDGWSPSIPQPLNIPDGTIEIMPGDTTLFWLSSHPGGEDLTYDLYLGNTNSPPLVAEDLTVNEWEITGLEFGDTLYWRVIASDQSGNEASSEVYRFNVLREGYFTDSRDGKKYGYLSIGNQMWMAENLAYLPAVSPASDGPEGESYPFYYVNGYNGTDVAEAKATINYETYGVLYNWFASMAGESSSDANPSNVQGVCPDGWHLPADGEWTELETWLTDNGYGYEGSGNDIGKALAATSGWATDDTPGNVGNDQNSNNSSGFFALPGGYPEGQESWYNIGAAGYWWSSTESSSTEAFIRVLDHDNSSDYRLNCFKEVGISVRCVRDIDILSYLTISGEAGFGNILINSGDTVQTIYLKNSGARELTIDSIPQLQQPFERTVTVAPIPPGDSLVVNITLHTDNPLNTYLDTLTIYIGKQDTAIAVSATLSDNMAVVLFPGSPADNDYDVDTTGTTLTWSGTDPEGETITYDVFFGADADPPIVSTAQTDTFYILPTLSSATVYYWRVVAKDIHSNVTTSSTRSFTTWKNDAPVLTLLQPADNSTDIAPDVILKWSATDDENDVMSYDIFFSTDNPPAEVQAGYTDTTYIIPGLAKNTVFYWKVIATDSYGNTTETNVFRFTTTNKVTGWIELSVTDATFTGLADVLFGVGSDNLFTGTTDANGKAGPFMLVTGTHPVNVKKAGYFNYFTNSIEVTEDDTTIADLVLPPIGDYNSDGDINQDDIDSLITEWRDEDFNYELGPASGVAPDFIVAPDSVLDFEDLMIFGMIWDYYNISAKSSIVSSSNIETGYVAGNNWNISCSIDEDITSGMVDLNFILSGKGNLISNNLIIKYDNTTLQYQGNRVLLTSDYSGVSFVNNYSEKGYLEICTGLLEDNYIQGKEDLVVVSFEKIGDNYNTPLASYEVHTKKSGKEIGIVEFNGANNITIYPNPASDMVIVDIHNSNVPAILKVISSTGRILLLKELTGTVEDIDISGLKSGMLIFIVTTDGEVCRKVIVKATRNQ